MINLPLGVCFRNKTRIIFILFLLLTGCSSSAFMLRFFYSQIDSKISDQINRYATFTDCQKSAIEDSVEEFTNWHRKNELTRYAVFLNEISVDVVANNVSDNDSLKYLNQARGFISSAFSQPLVTNSPKFLKSLSDAQVLEFKNQFSIQEESFQSWYKNRQNSNGKTQRLKKIVKNVRTITGVNLNNKQKDIIQLRLDEYQSNILHRHALQTHWKSTFIELLNYRDEPGFIKNLSTHISNYKTLSQKDNPSNYQTNQFITTRLISGIVNSLDARQREKLISHLQKIKNTLLEISAK